MGISLSNDVLPPPKIGGAVCSEKGCYNPCVSETGHRIRDPHKARCCAVCSSWYCGFHKKVRLLYTDIYPQSLCSDTDVHRWVYKCNKGNCMEFFGRHRS